jgi:two-component system chemotaxis response regulator CheY
MADVRILVVDDVGSVRVHIRTLLKSFGFVQVEDAASGKEAQAKIESQPFHLVLCDWHMAPIDGLALLKFIRGSESFKTMPFIMITAENTTENVVAAIQAGVDEYVVKPLTIKQIEEKVFKVLIRKKVI